MKNEAYEGTRDVYWKTEKAKDEARKALEATPEFKDWDKADKAFTETSKAYWKARDAVMATPEFKDWDEADKAYDVAKYAWEKVEGELNNEKNTSAL